MLQDVRRWVLFSVMCGLIGSAAWFVLFDDGGPGDVGYLLMAIFFGLVLIFDWEKIEWRPFGRGRHSERA